MKKCKFCAEEIQDEAIKCKHCGEDVVSVGKTAIDGESPVISNSFLKILGVLLFLGGVVASVYFYQYFDTSVETPTIELFGRTIGGGRVHNLGLMQQKQTGLIISVAVTVIGFVCLLITGRQKRK